MRIALGLSYSGQHYYGWQSQLNGRTIQDTLETALARFTGSPVRTICAGRTDSGVHALQQVVHFDTVVARSEMSWVRGTNRFLPNDIAVQWARVVPADFHARQQATMRRYSYLLLQSPVRPSIQTKRIGWSFLELNGKAMAQAAKYLLGEHDFSSFRASSCQSPTPIKKLHHLQIYRSTLRESHPCCSDMQSNLINTNVAHASSSCYWRFDFEANAFLHHMIRNIMGCLITIGHGKQSVDWMQHVLQARSRSIASPTFAADGLYFLGPCYAAKWQLPDSNAVFDSLPACPLEILA